VNFQGPALSDDSLRAVVDTVLNRPEYRWEHVEIKRNFLSRLFQDLMTWLFQLRDTNPALYQFIIWSLVAILLLILLHGGVVMYRTVRGASTTSGGGVEAARVVVRDARWYRQQAERLAAAGRYAEAMQAAFMHLVLRLDARDVLRYHPSKTPQEYAGEARLAEEEKARLRETVRGLYACVYAGARCDAMTYQEWMGIMQGDWHASQG
jgi:hypothetical protein